MRGERDRSLGLSSSSSSFLSFFLCGGRRGQGKGHAGGWLLLRLLPCGLVEGEEDGLVPLLLLLWRLEQRTPCPARLSSSSCSCFSLGGRRGVDLVGPSGQGVQLLYRQMLSPLYG